MAVYNPSVPCHLPLKQLSTNDLIFVNGVLTGERFNVDLETESGDIAFHFNPRVNERQVVRNTCIRGGWGGEERHGGFPFNVGQQFELVIQVHDAHYKVAVAGAHFIEYNHRIPKEAVRRLTIAGAVQLHAVRYQPANPYGFVPVPSGPSYPVFSPGIPYTGAIAGGLYPGRMIRISGVPRGNSFSINLQSGGHHNANIGLHFNVRFHHGGDHNVVVRNTMINAVWGGEERHAPHFPFANGAPFDVIVLAEASGFKVAVNNAHYIEYTHRLPLASIDHLNIQGDVQVNMIQYQ